LLSFLSHLVSRDVAAAAAAASWLMGGLVYENRRRSKMTLTGYVEIPACGQPRGIAVVAISPVNSINRRQKGEILTRAGGCRRRNNIRCR